MLGRRVDGTWYGRHEPPSGGPFFCAPRTTPGLKTDPPQERRMATATDRLLFLAAETAAYLMAPAVGALSWSASFEDALAYFLDRNAHLAVVAGEFDEPVGVLSLTDLLIHVRESAAEERIAPATAGE